MKEKRPGAAVPEALEIGSHLLQLPDITYPAPKLQDPQPGLRLIGPYAAKVITEIWLRHAKGRPH